MTLHQLLAIVCITIGLAGIAIWLRLAWLRHEVRRLRDRAELARHQALPPAYTDDTIRLAPYGAQPAPDEEIAGRHWRGVEPVERFRDVPCRRRNDPLPDDIPHGRDRLRVIARRRSRP